MIKKIFSLWVPLAAMWLVMGIEMPLINAVIARMNEAKANLAAFGVTLSLALIIESPIISMLTAGTALADNRENYRKLLRFMHIMALVLTSFHLILGLTPLYGFVLKYIIAVPEDIIPQSRESFIWMFPWSAAVGYRRLWQGVLIRLGKTKIIPFTMIARLAATCAVLLIGLFTPSCSGALAGGIALSFGVVAGAATSFFFLFPHLKDLPADRNSEALSWNRLFTFYYPLALTNFVTFIVRPVLTFGIARAAFPLESLAIWPVVTSFMFLFRSMALAYQEVAVSLLKNESDREPLGKFALFLGGGLSLIFLFAALSPFSAAWYHYAAGLSENLIPFTLFPTIIVATAPFFSGMTSWYRGLLVFRQKTSIVARAVFINSLTLLVLVLTIPMIADIQGGIIAALAFAISLAVETLYLKSRTGIRFSDGKA
ncbi:MAG: hypothetical protein JXR86_07780 [Spirochaetales bacterium]|nr:hypothetical protein [Spirochaetales bacterium]